ncbi:MAG TPA: DNA gyrase subunit A [Candidatus Excrementavichristensenella intestinipullorum]|nr:DNA gyrase subunit A [Candidatus Excrementavichristensenella intestinipullorum]
MDNQHLVNNVGRLTPIDLEDELKKSFISYAMAVIVTRALPDVRDGLKPVHRRILYSMMELGVTPDKPYRKSARIVGDCLGKYHPHGDSSVYYAMVRLAQDFSIRYTLVDGQGNFGSVDGDGAAAMRYTEARLTKLAMEMVSDIEKETVDFYPNFDETLMQPAVLPSRFPNLLVNGSNGIAVGMATNIPPHNLGEVVDGVVYMLDHPDCTTEDLMGFIKGPDFPTGGIILGKAGIHEAYATGRGRIITRARTEIEEMAGGRQRIVVTEIPYMVNKARLVEKMAELVHDKRLEGVSDIRDESDREGMRIVVELKRDVNAHVVLNTLYKHTQMQETFGVNMLALVDGEPKILSLRQCVHHYIDHQIDVITRRTRYDLDKARARAHILEGLLIALDNIDAVIHLIRSSRTDAQAKEGLMEQFGLSEKQAVAILDMRMRRLTGLEREKLEAEYAQLEKQIEYFTQVLANESMVRGIIKDEILALRAKYADPRRTQISQVDGEIDMLDLIQEEDMVVTLTHRGYVKRLPKDTYRAQRRGGKGIMGAAAREEDFVEQMYVTSTHDPLMFFTNRGRAYQMNCYEIPEAGRTARGTAIVNLLQLEGGERVNTMLPIPEEKVEGHYLVMVTRNGIIKRTALNEFTNMRRTGLIALILKEDDDLIAVRLTDGHREIFVGTRQGMSIRFSEEDVRCMGRAATGVKAIELAPGDAVVDAAVLEEDAQVLSITENGYGKRTQLDEYRVQSRGGKGVKAMNLTDKTGPLARQLLVHEEEDVLILTDDGIIIRTPVSSISVLGRATQGVRVMRVAQEAKVVCVARAEAEEDLPEDELDQEVLSGDSAAQDGFSGEEDAASGEYAQDGGDDQRP